MTGQLINPAEALRDPASAMAPDPRTGMPSLRNELAHGSPMLTRQVIGTMELVAEILNQLCPNQPASSQPA